MDQLVDQLSTSSLYCTVVGFFFLFSVGVAKISMQCYLVGMSTCRQEGLGSKEHHELCGTVVDSLYAASGSLMQPRRPSQHDGHDSVPILVNYWVGF